MHENPGGATASAARRPRRKLFSLLNLMLCISLILFLFLFFVRKKVPKLVLCAGDSSSDTSTFTQQSLSTRSSLAQPIKSQSLPGA